LPNQIESLEKELEQAIKASADTDSAKDAEIKDLRSRCDRLKKLQLEQLDDGKLFIDKYQLQKTKLTDAERQVEQLKVVFSMFGE